MLFDTDVVVAILRQHPPAIAWMSGSSFSTAALPGLVAMEAVQGCGDLADQRRVERFLRRLTWHWPTEADCRRAYRDFAALRLSHGIDLLDTLIAATAIGLHRPLATFNVKHYRMIADLELVQPY